MTAGVIANGLASSSKGFDDGTAAKEHHYNEKELFEVVLWNVGAHFRSEEGANQAAGGERKCHWPYNGLHAQQSATTSCHNAPSTGRLQKCERNVRGS